MLRKKMNILLFMSVIILSLSGCSKGDIIEKKIDSSKAIDKTDIEDGLYILTEKGKFYKPNKENQSFNDVSVQASSTRVIWSVNDQKVIPTLYKDDKLVYFSKNILENDFVIEKFKSTGYSIGVYGLSTGTNGDINISSNNIIAGSTFSSQLDKIIKNGESVAIEELSGKKVSEDKLKRGGIIPDLEKNKKYKIGIYKGTYYGKIEVLADTRFFVSEKTDYTKGFQKTKSGYVIVDTGNLENGYYSINGEGLFRVTDKKR